MSRENRFRLSAAVPENDEIRMTNGEGTTKSELAHDASDKVSWNSQVPSVVREEASEKGVVYDLEERTARFGEAVIDFVKTIPQDAVTNRITTRDQAFSSHDCSSLAGAKTANSNPLD
jgi:hypothetical protein